MNYLEDMRDTRLALHVIENRAGLRVQHPGVAGEGKPCLRHEPDLSREVGSELERSFGHSEGIRGAPGQVNHQEESVEVEVHMVEDMLC